MPSSRSPSFSATRRLRALRGTIAASMRCRRSSSNAVPQHERDPSGTCLPRVVLVRPSSRRTRTGTARAARCPGSPRPMSSPRRRKMPNPYAVSKWRWRSHAPQRARNASGSVTGRGSRARRAAPTARASRGCGCAPSRQASQSSAANGRSSTRGPVSDAAATHPSTVRSAAAERLRTERSVTDGRCADAGDRLVWIDLEMTGLDVDAAHDRRDRGARHRRRPGGARRRHRPRRAPAARRRSPRWTTTCGRCTRESGLLPAIEASTLTLETRARGRSSTCAATCRSAGRRRCAATRSASTAASSTVAPELDGSCTTAASTCRRSRSCAGVGPRRCTGSGPSKEEAHRALDDIRESIAELVYYRDHDPVAAPDGGRAP